MHNVVPSQTCSIDCRRRCNLTYVEPPSPGRDTGGDGSNSMASSPNPCLALSLTHSFSEHKAQRHSSRWRAIQSHSKVEYDSPDQWVPNSNSDGVQICRGSELALHTVPVTLQFRSRDHGATGRADERNLGASGIPPRRVPRKVKTRVFCPKSVGRPPPVKF